MRRLDLWVGEWKGSGWSLSALGKRTDFALAESVQRKVGGTVLFVEGHGTATGGDGQETMTHDGLVLVSYDEKTGRYCWNGHERASGPVDVEPKIFDGGLEWSLRADEHGTVVRFTIKFDEHRWREVGEASADGKNWNMFMKMTLARQ